MATSKHEVPQERLAGYETPEDLVGGNDLPIWDALPILGGKPGRPRRWLGKLVDVATTS